MCAIDFGHQGNGVVFYVQTQVASGGPLIIEQAVCFMYRFRCKLFTMEGKGRFVFGTPKLVVSKNDSFGHL